MGWGRATDYEVRTLDLSFAENMKFLRNPIVTGALVVVAIGIVVYQCLPMFRNRGGGATTADTTTVAAPAQPVPPASTTPNSPAVETKNSSAPLPKQKPMDRSNIALNFTGWLRNAARDPFLLVEGSSQKKVATQGPSPLANWKLKAIWLQTGSGGRLAAINQSIYKEGDMIEGYRIEKIDEDTVWFQTPDSREHLSFKKVSNVVAPPPTTNSLSNTNSGTTPDTGSTQLQTETSDKP